MNPKPDMDEATIEWTWRTIAREVRKSHLRGIGLPAGAGAVGLVIAAVTWLPAQIGGLISPEDLDKQISQVAQSHLRTEVGSRHIAVQFQRLLRSDPAMRKTFESVVTDYLQNEGGLLLSDHVSAKVGDQVRGTVVTFMEGPEGRRELQSAVAAGSERYLGDSGVAKMITQHIEHELDPKTGSGRLREIIAPQLQNVAKALATEVRDDQEKLIAKLVDDVVGASEAHAKAAGPPLEVFLRSYDVANSDKPISLEFVIRRGRRYAEFAIRDYLDRMRERYGDRFSQVQFMDDAPERGGEPTFLALTSPAEFAEKLGSEFMTLINASADEKTTEQVGKELQEYFGMGAVTPIQLDWSVKKALRQPIWRDPQRDDEAHAVVNDKGRLIGTTTRAKLLASLW